MKTVLDDLIAKGAIIAPASVRVKKSIHWQSRGDDGTAVDVNFDVHIKRDMSAADFQFIFSAAHDEDYAMMARRVHRLVTLGENGDEKIPYEAAASMRVSLLIAICNAINEVEKEREIVEPPAKEGEEKN